MLVDDDTIEPECFGRDELVEVPVIRATPRSGS
jgi:hypothetical protein